MAVYPHVLLIALLFLKISAEIHPSTNQSPYDENSSYQKEVLNEDDYMDESDSISDGQKKSYILDDAHMEWWQKRLRWISKWMDQMSSNYARGQPRMFERYSRGRLDRMPLSYGKRSSGYKQTFLKEGHGDLLKNIRRRLQRIPVPSRKIGNFLQDNNNILQDILEAINEPRESEEDKLEDEIHNQHFALFDNARVIQEHNDELNERPISYGKRSWEDFFSTGPYSRNSRSRLERMPLLYGKRGFESFYVDCQKEESIRPVDISITGEKEGQFYIKCNPVKSPGSVPAKEHVSRDEDLAVDKSHKMTLYLDELSPLIRMRRSLLEPVPFSNSKEIYNPYNPFQQPIIPSLDTPIHDAHVHPKEMAPENLDFYKRSRLERMPLTYGKRLINSIELYSKRSRLNRMPLTYGKRDVATSDEFQSGAKDSVASKTFLNEIVNKKNG